MSTLREEIQKLVDNKDVASLTELREVMEGVEQHHEVVRKMAENVLLTCRGNIELVKNAVDNIHNHK